MLIELSITPLGRGTHLSRELADILKIIDDSHVRYCLTPFGTCLEGEWAEVILRKAWRCAVYRLVGRSLKFPPIVGGTFEGTAGKRPKSIATPSRARLGTVYETSIRSRDGRLRCDRNFVLMWHANGPPQHHVGRVLCDKFLNHFNARIGALWTGYHRSKRAIW